MTDDRFSVFGLCHTLDASDDSGGDDDLHSGNEESEVEIVLEGLFKAFLGDEDERKLKR